MIQFLEEADRLIRINSVSQNGNEEIAVYLQSLMQRMGFKSSLQEVSHSLEGVSKRQFNVIGILGDPLVDITTKKGLLLNTHIDTVGPGVVSHWTETGGDPFRASIKDGKIFGLGSADVKLDFLCKLKACERYKERRLKMPIYLVGTAAEEIGMLGAKFLIKSRALNPKYVLVGEPSSLSAIYAHKAYSVYQVGLSFSTREKDARGYNTRVEIKTTGRSTHASYPDLGTNAVLRMLEVVEKIKAANFTFRLSRVAGGESVNKVPDSAMAELFLASSSFDDFRRYFRDHLNLPDVNIEFGGLGETGSRFQPDNMLEAISGVNGVFKELQGTLLSPTDATYNPGTSTVNLGRITSRTGTQDGATDLHFDVRLLPEVSPDDFDKQLKARLQEVNAKFPNIMIKVTRNRFNPALNMKQDSDLVKAALEAQKSARIDGGLDKKATSTEAAQYFAAGFDAIVFGPGKSMGNSHTANEHNIVDHLDKAVHFYDRMIERFCL